MPTRSLPQTNISSRTFVSACLLPCQYPHGTVDPIVELGKLAHSRGVGLHVDCCLGSFVVRAYCSVHGVGCVRSRPVSMVPNQTLSVNRPP